MKKPPKPKKWDNVERIDMTKMFGVVKKIISNTKVLVTWVDKAKEENVEEKIKDLALVKRPGKGILRLKRRRK